MRIPSCALYNALLKDLTPHRYSWVETRTVASEALLSSIFKKYEDTSSKADDAALDLFLKMNEHCANVSIDVILPPSLTYARAILTDLLYPKREFFLTEELFQEGCDFGPHAAIAARGESFYQKSGDGPLSTTASSLYATYVAALRTPTSYSAELTRRRRYGVVSIVQGSKLGFVPKNSEISRVICTEPLLNMFVQKGMGRAIETVLEGVGINLSEQQHINRHLARFGSISGRLGTIDLSSASDTISLNVCKALLPPFLLELLMECRSPVTTLPDGRVVPLHMISSMGNGFTFPLQTLLFYAIACGVYEEMGIKPIADRRRGVVNIGVNGDDMIVEAQAFDNVLIALRACGFIPNHTKSFNTGFFRESCGGDYYKGHNVRGVYCKSLETDRDIYSLINRLNRWSAVQGIALTKTITLLCNEVKFLPIPIWEQDDVGIKIPLSLVVNLKRAIKLPKCESEPFYKGSFLYRAWNASKDCVRLDDEDNLRLDQASKPVKNKLRHVVYNSDGVLQAALKGSLRGGVISRRENVERSRIITKVAPGWDEPSWSDSVVQSLKWGAWKQASEANLPFLTLRA